MFDASLRAVPARFSHYSVTYAIPLLYSILHMSFEAPGFIH
jgi:hypothetical protein